MATDRRLPTDADTDRLIGFYEQAEWELRSIIRGAALRGAKGTARYFRSQHRKVEAIVTELRVKTPALVGAAVSSTYNGAAFATSKVHGLEPGFTGVDRDAIRILSQELGQRLDDSLVTVGRQADDVLRRVTLEEVAGAKARGETSKQASPRIRARLADEGVTSFRDRSGRRWRMSVYAAMAARTTAREASTAGVVNRMETIGEDLIQISNHHTETELCKLYEGKTYSLSGRSTRYPKVEALPPFHPNCWHVAHPGVASFEDFERELGLAPTAPDEDIPPEERMPTHDILPSNIEDGELVDSVSAPPPPEPKPEQHADIHLDEALDGDFGGSPPDTPGRLTQQGEPEPVTGRDGYVELVRAMRIEPDEDQSRIFDRFSKFGSLMGDMLRGRETMTGKVEVMVGVVDRTLADAPLPAPVRTWRGVDALMPGLADLEVGDVMSDPAFLSTSLDRPTAERFATGGALFRIELPEGHAGLPIGAVHHTDDYNEFEVILPRDTMLIVGDVDRSGAVPLFTLRARA